MLLRLLTILIVLLLMTPAWSATYWASPTGTAATCGAASGTDDPGIAAGNTTTTSPAYLTLANVATKNCATSGDTVMLKNFEYGTSTKIKLNQLFVNANGTAGNTSKVLCEVHRGCTIAWGDGSGAHGIIEVWDTDYFQVGDATHGLDIDGKNCTTTGSDSHCIGLMWVVTSGATSGRAPGARLTGNVAEGNYIHNHKSSGIGNGYDQTNNKRFTGFVWRLNKIDPQPSLSTGNPHPLYLAADNSLVELNYTTTHASTVNPGSYTYHCNHFCFGNIFQKNIGIANNPTAYGIVTADPDGGRSTGSNIIRDNIFRVATGVTPSAAARCLNPFSSGSATYYGNVCDGFPIFIRTENGAPTTAFNNNLCTNGTCGPLFCTSSGCGTSSTTYPGSLTCTVACGTANPTVTAATHFKDAVNLDYSLKSGSSQIDAGVAITGVLFNGTARDRGPFETFGCTTATINNATIDLTCNMALNSPVQTSGSTGWTAGCTGTGCGTPVVSSTAVPSGSSTIIRITLTGIGGGNACAVGQTWTLTYSSTTGNATDSANIGAGLSPTNIGKNQPLFSFTNLSVTNACTGGGVTAPPNPYIYYTLNDNTGTTATDTGSAGLNGTLNGGASWTSAFNSFGVALTPSSTQSISVPYGNAVNPTVTSLTIAFWVNVTAGQESSFVSYFGSPTGTNQRLYVTTKSGTWQVGVQNKSDSSPNAASDLTVQAGWNRVCLVLDAATPGSGTGTATLTVNGVTSVSASAVKTYTSYALAGNFELGKTAGITTGGGGIFDEFKIWQSKVSCSDDFLSQSPVSSGWTGTISMVSGRFYGAKLNAAGARVPLTTVSTNWFLSTEGAAAVLLQTDCTAANCTPISQRLYYTCALCPSAGAERTVPDSATTDGVAFYANSDETGLLSGDHGALLSGALSRLDGSTQYFSDGIPVFDLAQNQSVVHGYIIRFDHTTAGRQYCFYVKEQSGLALNNVTPSGGICLTATTPAANAGY